MVLDTAASYMHLIRMFDSEDITLGGGDSKFSRVLLMPK